MNPAKQTQLEQSNRSTSLRVMRETSRYRRWYILLSVSLGLFLTLAALWFVSPKPLQAVNWPLVASTWIVGLTASLLTAVLLWKKDPNTLASVARALDLKWSIKNRLEAAAELQGDSSPIAEAQGSDAASHIVCHAIPGRKRWRFCVCLLGSAILIHLLLFCLWPARHCLSFLAWKARVAAEEAARPPKASLKWIAPRQEILAN
ncbi:MAG: hypothetical protein RLZZ408_136, partial [Verrucomicrobiota bacterium]